MLESGHSFDTLSLTSGSRPVLRGEQSVQLREGTANAPAKRTKKTGLKLSVAAESLNQDGQVRFINLKAWRAEVAREHNLPAFVIFHDSTDFGHWGEEVRGVWGRGVAGVREPRLMLLRWFLLSGLLRFSQIQLSCAALVITYRS